MNIAISELQTSVEELNDNDLLLVSVHNDNNDTYQSAKAKCKILLDIIKSLTSRINSLISRVETLESKNNTSS